MGGFFVLQGFPGTADRCQSILNAAHSAFSCIKEKKPSQFLGSGVNLAFSLDRMKGAERNVALDVKTGSWMVSSGNLFYPAPATSDVAPQLLKDYLGGIPVWERLDGSFALAIYDSRLDELVLISDRLGTYHAFIAFAKECAMAGNSSLAMASLLDSPLDQVGRYEFLSTGVLYEDRTLFRDVKKVAPASIYRFRQGRLFKKSTYWEPENLPYESIKPSQAPEQMLRAMKHAASKLAASKRLILCDLTGGYDTRVTITALMAAGVPFSTVVHGSDILPDVRVANSIANMLGLDHRQNSRLFNSPEELFEALGRTPVLTDGEVDSFEFAPIYMKQTTFARQFDCTLNGGGGAMIKGIWWDLVFPRTGARRRIDYRDVAERRFARTGLDLSMCVPEIRLDLVDHFEGILKRAHEKTAHLPNTAQIEISYLKLRMQRWQGRLTSSTDQIWPCITLFLDFRESIETALCVDHRGKQYRRLIQRLLTQANPKLAAHPLEGGYPALTPRLSNLHLFAPLVQQLARRVLKRVVRIYKPPSPPGSGLGSLSSRLWELEAYRDLLEPSRMLSVSLYDAAGLKGLLGESRSPGFGKYRQLGRVMALEQALRAAKSARVDIGRTGEFAASSCARNRIRHSG